MCMEEEERSEERRRTDRLAVIRDEDNVDIPEPICILDIGLPWCRLRLRLRHLIVEILGEQVDVLFAIETGVDSVSW